MTARRHVVLASVVLITVFASSSPAQESQIYRPGPGITNPTLVRQVQPSYTREGMRQKLQGVVTLEAVVKKDGTVGDVRVVKSLGEATGLDAEAVRAAKQWVFNPAIRRATPGAEATPIDIYVTLQLTFRLSDRGAFFPGAPGVVAPVPRNSPKPEYTEEARGQKVEGVVVVEARVGVDGKVQETRIRTSLDEKYGLDTAAMSAVQQMTFWPARLGNREVAAVVYVDVPFTLK